MTAYAKLAREISGAGAHAMTALWRDYLRALRADLIEEMVDAADGGRDQPAHQVQIIDRILSDTEPKPTSAAAAR